MTDKTAQALFDELNQLHFRGKLPRHRVIFRRFKRNGVPEAHAEAAPPGRESERAALRRRWVKQMGFGRLRLQIAASTPDRRCFSEMTEKNGSGSLRRSTGGTSAEGQGQPLSGV